MKFHFLPAQGLRLSVPDFSASPLSPAVALPFLIGLFCGTVIGDVGASQLGFGAAQEVSQLMAGSGGPASVFWRSSRFLLIAFLLSTSLLGVVLVPAFCAIRAYMLSCAVSAFLRLRLQHSLLYAFVWLGLPALLSLPAFLLAASDALFLSRRLVGAAQGGGEPLRLAFLPRHLLLIALLWAAELSYGLFLLPAVLKLLA